MTFLGPPGPAGQPGRAGNPGMAGIPGRDGNPGTSISDGKYCPCPPRTPPSWWEQSKVIGPKVQQTIQKTELVKGFVEAKPKGGIVGDEGLIVEEGDTMLGEEMGGGMTEKMGEVEGKRRRRRFRKIVTKVT